MIIPQFLLSVERICKIDPEEKSGTRGGGGGYFVDGNFQCKFYTFMITIQVDSVQQLVRALHRNHRTAGSIPARGSIYSCIFHNYSWLGLNKCIKFAIEIFILLLYEFQTCNAKSLLIFIIYFFNFSNSFFC